MIAAIPFVVTGARAEDGQWYALRADDGSPIQNFRVPAEMDPVRTPGIVWRGAEIADTVLYEFFDYNCPYCRKAAYEIDEIVAKDSSLRLGLINDPILSLASAQAAKVQQGVLRLHGPAVAYDFHLRMFARRGHADGLAALEVTRGMGLDPAKVEESGDSPSVGQVLSRQAQLSSDLGMATTPAFVVAGIGILGWPGGKTLKSIVDSSHRCSAAVCEEK